MKSAFRDAPIDGERESRQDNYRRDVKKGKDEKPYTLYDRTQTTTTNTSSTYKSHKNNSTSDNSNDIPKTYSKGVAYGLFDKNANAGRPFTRGVAYSLFDKNFMSVNNQKSKQQKGQYDTYDKRAEMINLQVEEDAKMRPLDFEKGTYFTFGRMKEHLFFRYDKSQNRNYHNNTSSNNNYEEQEKEEILEVQMGMELEKLLVKDLQIALENTFEVELEKQLAMMSLNGVTIEDE